MTVAAQPTGDLTAASTPELRSPGQFAWRVEDGWQQGRGAFGGLVLAALVRALEASEPDRDRQLRALDAELAGPVVPGDATIEVTELRRGKGLSSWSAVLSQGGQALARASAVLARTRGDAPPRLHVAPPANAAAWREHEPAPVDRVPGAPVFTRHLAFRTIGPLPFSGGKDGVAEGWVQMRRAPPSLGAAEVVALADAWWPAILAVWTAPRPTATVAFALQRFPPPTPLDPSVPLYYRAHTLTEHEGFVIEFRELWTDNGQLVALNQQTFAVI